MGVTNMSALLAAIKTVFLAAKVTTGIDYIKKGVLPIIPVFPVIALLPELETILEYHSGGRYIIQRDISLEVYEKGFKSNIVNERLKDFVDKIVTICQTQNTLGANKWGSTTLDSTWENESYETPMETENQIIQVAILPMSFTSEETLPSNRIISQTVTETNQSDLIDEIYNKIVTYINGTDNAYDLTKVKQIYKKEIPPMPVYPSITIVGRGVNRERKLTGEDMPVHNIEIAVWTKLLDKEIMLDKNLELIDTLKDAVQFNFMWSGKCYDSYIDSIEYERLDISKIGMVYASRMSLKCEGRENIYA